MCEIYFRVLKISGASTCAGGSPLLGPTLDGLSRVAHLIDYQVVADILEASMRCFRELSAAVTRCGNVCGTGSSAADVERPAATGTASTVPVNSLQSAWRTGAMMKRVSIFNLCFTRSVHPYAPGHGIRSRHTGIRLKPVPSGRSVAVDLHWRPTLVSHVI